MLNQNTKKKTCILFMQVWILTGHISNIYDSFQDKKLWFVKLSCLISNIKIIKLTAAVCWRAFNNRFSKTVCIFIHACLLYNFRQFTNNKTYNIPFCKLKATVVIFIWFNSSLQIHHFFLVIHNAATILDPVWF